MLAAKPGKDYVMAKGGDGRLFWRKKNEQELERDMSPEERSAKQMKAMNDETSRLNAMSGLRAAQERVRKDQEADRARAGKERMDKMMADGSYFQSVEGREEALRRGLITPPQPQQPGLRNTANYNVRKGIAYPTI